MSSILTCPACQGEVTLPEGLVERLECPHCQNELQLRAPLFTIPPTPRPAAVASAETVPQAPTAVADYRKRVAQQAQRPSMLGQMVGIVAGGVLGMVMGYWLLNYFGGPRYDFLNVPLPLVPHTQTARHDPAHPPAAHSLPVNRPIATEGAPASALQAPVVSPHVDLPLPVPTPAVRSFPSYTSDQLGEALAAAKTAAGCEHCQATGVVKKGDGGAKPEACELCGGKPTGRINAEAYAKFCRLAEVLTFIEVAAGDAEFLSRKEAVEQVFLRAAVDREKQAALGRLATLHLKNRERAQSGVLLAGTVQAIGQSGDYHWARLLLFGLPEEVAVVYRTAARLKAQDRVLVAGSIINEPRQNLPGYLGTEPHVVWGGLPMHLPSAL